MNRTVDNFVRVALVLLATLRLTRFVTSDHLGEWWIVGPAKRWAWHSEAVTGPPEADPVPSPPITFGWRSKAVSGLDCPFCVGFWLGLVILLGEVTVGRSRLRPLWRLGLAALGLNYVVGHLSSRID